MSKGKWVPESLESQIITKTKSGKSQAGNLSLSWPRPFQLLRLPVSEGNRERRGFLRMPTVEVPTLAPTISAARVGNQQPTFFSTQLSFLFCNFVLMRSAFITIHLHCPLFKSWRLQTYPGIIFKETNKQTRPQVSRPLINSSVCHACLCPQAAVERVCLLVGTKLEVHVTRRETPWQ